MNGEDHDDITVLKEKVETIDKHVVVIDSKIDRIYWLVLTTLLGVVITQLV